MMKNKVKKYDELNSLKGRIREKNTSYRKLSSRLNIGVSTLSDKINGFYLFDVNEVDMLMTELDISPLEIAKYFFPQKLRNAI